MDNENMNGANTDAAAKTYPPMEMTATVRPIEPTKNLVGFANVTFNGAVTVTDFKVLKDADGNLFVGMPSKPDKTSRTGYSATTRISDPDVKQQLTGAVVTEYYAAVEKQKARAAALDGDKPPRIADQVKDASKKAAEHNAKLPAADKSAPKQTERT